MLYEFRLSYMIHDHPLLCVLLRFDWTIVDCVSPFLEYIRFGFGHLLLMVYLVVGSWGIKLFLLRRLSVENMKVSFLPCAWIGVQEIFAILKSLVIFCPNFALSTVETYMGSWITLDSHSCTVSEWIVALDLFVFWCLKPTVYFFRIWYIWAGSLWLSFLSLLYSELCLLLWFKHMYFTMFLMFFFKICVDLQWLSFLHALSCCFLLRRFLNETSLSWLALDSCIHSVRWKLVDFVDYSRTNDFVYFFARIEILRWNQVIMLDALWIWWLRFLLTFQLIEGPFEFQVFLLQMWFLFLILLALFELSHDFLHHTMVCLYFDFLLGLDLFDWGLGHALGVSCTIVLWVTWLRECRVWL